VSASEVAVVFHGRCPACDDLPTGEWFNGGSFNSDCGHTLVAYLFYDSEGHKHWRFERDVWTCDGCGRDCPQDEVHVEWGTECFARAVWCAWLPSTDADGSEPGRRGRP
jgi:hypothetical protein